MAELSVVLTILAVITSAVAIRSYAVMRQVQMKELAAQLAEYERLTRFQARQQDRPLRIVVDLSENEIRRTDDCGNDCGEILKVPHGCKLARLLVGREDLWGGRASVSCSRLGLTPTYALRLEQTAGGGQWLIFAGLSGELIKADDETQVQQILEIASRRSDTR